METTYFNFSTNVYSEAQASRWDRWELTQFLRGWWRIYAPDPRWVPPYYPQIRSHLRPPYADHLARMQPTLLGMEALARRARQSAGAASSAGMAMSAAGGGAFSSRRWPRRWAWWIPGARTPRPISPCST